jgi:hypothetical protein
VICPPCKTAADVAVDLDLLSAETLQPVRRHDPSVCRDAAIQPNGCGCQHGQPREAKR